MKTVKQIEKDLNDVIKIQCSHGNYNYDPYMWGLANGLIMAKSLVTGKEPEFIEKPRKWLGRGYGFRHFMFWLRTKIDKNYGHSYSVCQDCSLTKKEGEE